MNFSGHLPCAHSLLRFVIKHKRLIRSCAADVIPVIDCLQRYRIQVIECC